MTIHIPASVTTLGVSSFGNNDFSEFLFLGNAPENVDLGAFSGTFSTIYYLPGTTGWTDYYWYGCPIEEYGYEYVPVNNSYLDEIAIWNQAALDYAGLMYSAEDIDWSIRMNTLEQDELSVLTDLAINITEGYTTDAEKAYQLYLWLTQNISYNDAALFYDAYEVYENNIAVCSGYTLLYGDLLMSIGIPSLYVSGYLSSSTTSFVELFALDQI